MRRPVALGDIVQGLSAEVVWHPTFPYKSSLTGQTCQELADQYSNDTGKGWTEPIGQYGKFEWAIDVCKRTKDLDNKEEYLTAIQSTKLNTINGLIDFTAPVKMGTSHPVLNVNLVHIASGQWVKTARRRVAVRCGTGGCHRSRTSPSPGPSSPSSTPSVARATRAYQCRGSSRAAASPVFEGVRE